MTPDYKGPWVALYAKTTDSKAFMELTCVERSVFFHTFLLAARTERDFLYHQRSYHLLPGQFVITISDLAQQCGYGCTEKIVRRTVDKLVKYQTWAHQRADGRADAPNLITFINWSCYQLSIGKRADGRADGRADEGHTEGTLPLSTTDGKNSNKEGTLVFGTQTRKPPQVPKVTAKPKPAMSKDAVEVLAYLNQTADTKFREPGEIPARLAEGHTVEECKIIIDKKCNEWLRTDFAKNLNPVTLFRPIHFDTYLNQKGLKPIPRYNAGAMKGEPILINHHGAQVQENKRPTPPCDTSKMIKGA